MKKILLSLVCLFIISMTKAQDRAITTGVPFLLVAADARAAGMADIGVATSADAFSQQWNPAKYAFALDKQGLSISYTPYLTSLVNDISLGQLTYYNKLDDRSAFAGSIRYFSLGEIELRENATDQARVVKPSEFALDLSYSLKLSPLFSMSVGGRFISSNLNITTEGQSNSAASSFAFDLSGFYQSEEIAYSDFNGRWRWGFNFQNLGPKINYDLSQSDNGSNFLPSNLKVGTGFDFIFDDYNKVAVNLEFNKLLVPTPQIPVPIDLNGDGDTTDALENGVSQSNNDYNKIGWVSGIFKSFGDAPDGFSEELKEITYAVGAEYLYQDSFAMRLGYFHESPEKGARQFFSLGAGFKYTTIKVDVSYLFSASKVQNPLENTLRFSLTFNFGEKYDEY
jgi:Type IX secretion system protein PorV